MLRTSFQDQMPEPGEPADIVLLDPDGGRDSGADIALSPDGRWLVNGHRYRRRDW